ncbi:MAG: enoyl-CoA hydratase/isomerase family protein [Betaproteobacteria bacterium]|nr:enoyl-CoA hydratase/isomerase family protein [Betaproteobacteria bacterium]
MSEAFRHRQAKHARVDTKPLKPCKTQHSYSTQQRSPPQARLTFPLAIISVRSMPIPSPDQCPALCALSADYFQALKPLHAGEGAPWGGVHQGLALLVLARPEQHNRLDPADVDAMQTFWGRLQDASVLVITAMGNQTFSSGYTIEAIVQNLDDRFEQMLDGLESLPLLSIAALNGSVYGGGTDLALCCDLRLGLCASRMFMPAARFGLHYYPGGLRRYVQRLGLSAASMLMLTAQTIDDACMLRIGFLHERHESHQALSQRLTVLIEAQMANDAAVVAAMKRDLASLAANRFDHAAARESFVSSLQSPSLAQRLKAAGERRSKKSAR